jgi:DNA replication protein DnaC
MTATGGMGVGDLIANMKRRRAEEEAEHERRIATDPEYRAEHEQRKAEQREREEADKRERAHQRRMTIEKARDEKGIPEKFRPYLDAWRAGTVAGLAPSIAKAHGWAERFLRRSAGWSFLLLGGPVGVGKTAAACWFLDAPLVSTERHPFTGEIETRTCEARGRFVTAEELAKASTFESEFWDPIRDASRLVVDDLGWEQHDGKGWALSNLTGLLAYRHAHDLPTVITLNVDKATFMERYAAHDGGRLRDRLAESAWFVSLSGPSQRKRLALEDTPTTPLE